MIVKTVAEIWTLPEKREDFLPLAKELVEKSAAEDGCIEYRLFVDREDDNHFAIVEEWESMEKVEAHRETEHFTRIMPAVGAFVAKPPSILRMKPAF